jgi:hypothetical protein
MENRKWGIVHIFIEKMLKFSEMMMFLVGKEDISVE